MSQASVLLVVLLSSRVAAPAAQECGQDAAGVREIRAVATGIIAADNERAIERVLAFYTPDAIWMPPEQDAVVGREKIRARYEALFAAFTPEISPTVEQACVAEGLGFVRGHNGGRVVDRATGAARDLDDAYLMLLRREGDGAWRISHLMWHRRSRASAPAGH